MINSTEISPTESVVFALNLIHGAGIKGVVVMDLERYEELRDLIRLLGRKYTGFTWED